MTTANVNITNLNHHQFDDNHTLLFGEISSIVKKAESINIPGNIESNTHIVLAKSDSDYIFKTTMVNSPVINNYDITLYDHSSTSIAKYLKGRDNNNYGSTKSMLSSVKFISEVMLPNIGEDEIVYLVIDNYNALNDVLLEESIEKLIHQDFSNFIKNNGHLEREQMRLFIKKDIYDSIKDYVNLENIFDKIVPKSDTIGSLIEYLMGKNISCSDISYQTNLTISEDVDILSTAISPSTTSKLIGRSNHALQLNIYSENSKFHFVSLLKHKERLEKLSIVTINTVSSIVKSSEIFEDSLNHDCYNDWKTLKDNILFFIELENNVKKNSILEFVTQNTDKVVKYLFDPDIKEIDDINNIQKLIEHSNSKFVKSIVHLLNSERRKIKSKSGFIPGLPSPHFYDKAILGRQHSIARINYPDNFD